MSKTKVDKAALVNAWLGNPAVVYTLVAIIAGASIYFFAPAMFNRIQGWFSGGVDRIFNGLADIFGRPASQEPAKRKVGDSVRGLVVEGDRALSDLYDHTFGTFF